MMSELPDLPDCVISHIFSKLSLKSLVKTSALSKQWYHEWGLRKDLNFDLHNMFDYNTIPKFPITLTLFQELQSLFATRLDNFMQKYHGDMIRSIRINFPLDAHHTHVINGLIHKGVVKGANRIELLFAHHTRHIQPYKFVFPFLSCTNSVTYLHLRNCHIAAPMEFSGFKNLTTLVLQLLPLDQNILQPLFFNCIYLQNLTLNQCTFRSDLTITSPTLLHFNINCRHVIGGMKTNIHIIASNLLSMEYSSYFCPRHTLNFNSPMLSKFSYSCHRISNFVDFSGLKNMKTIVLDRLLDCLQTDVITHLFSKCLLLEHVTFNNCKFTCDLKIRSATLLHLSIVNCLYYKNLRCYDFSHKLDIDALNLSSFEYRSHTVMRPVISLAAPKLFKVFWDAGFRKRNVSNFAKIARLHLVQNLTMNMSFSQIPKLTKDLVRFQNLKQLKLFIVGAYNPKMDYFWILDIAMASQHLQKLSLTIRNGHTERSHMVGSGRQRREYAKFCHNELKYVELHGCVCSINVIELASHLLRSATLLKQITFSSRRNFYIGAGRWSKDPDDCCWFQHDLIHQHLKHEVNQQCHLIIF
ncbi:unnamed protein product [Lathyrus oleraceus]